MAGRLDHDASGNIGTALEVIHYDDMKFARIVFIGAGVWGIAILTPMFFLFDTIGRMRGSPITNPDFFYGFLAVALAWQCAFLVIGSDPARYRLMMIPSLVEKFGYILTMALLYTTGRITATDLAVIPPDLLLGILFAIAFVKTTVSP